jgi:protein-L-isoaspartate(D-aspartate) O-methyltransferase
VETDRPAPGGEPALAQARRAMVDLVRSRGVRDARVLDAMARVPREAFVPQALRWDAYEDAPLPIGEGQTISQPYMVAYMVEALGLAGGERVLEVGAGSGYAAAVLGRLAEEVWTVERHRSLVERAAATLAGLGVRNVHVVHGDGILGWPARAPYDAIVVAAGGERIPEALTGQLAEGGRLVIPVGPEPDLQRLVRLTRRGAALEREELAEVRFVPLVGAESRR